MPVPARVTVEGEIRATAAHEAVTRPAKAGHGRRQRDRARPGDVHEARERAGGARRERLLPVVAVVELEDREPAAREPRRREPGETRAERRASRRDRDARTVHAVGADLAPIRDVQLDRARALRPAGLREREVVDAGAGQRPAAARTGVEERCELPVRARIGRPARRAQELRAPEIGSGRERRLDAGGVCRACLRRGARLPYAACAGKSSAIAARSAARVNRSTARPACRRRRARATSAPDACRRTPPRTRPRPCRPG